MEKLKQLWQVADHKLLLSDLVLGLVINPIFLKQHFISRIQVVFWILLLVNGGYSIWAGRRMARLQVRGWQILVFPLFYLLGVHFFNIAHYTYYFALVYLGMIYLAKSLTNDTAAKI